MSISQEELEQLRRSSISTKHANRVYSFDVKKTDKVLTKEEIISLPEFKELQALGFDLISTPRDLKNDVYVFGIDKNIIVPKDNMKDTYWYTDPDIKYYPDMLIFYRRGYIRTQGEYYAFNKSGGSPVGSYNPTTEEGWKEGLLTAIRICKKKVQRIERDFGHILSKEEQHRKRGLLMGKKFGF